jgi:deazaflavin-dependent oxidoreductase (nitroreductase family)
MTSRRVVTDRAHRDSRLSFCQGHYRALVRPTVKFLARVHLGLLRASGGNLGHRLFGGRVVLLTTVGRRSGRQRTTPLAYMRHGDSLVVAASCGGSERIPDWWLNLQHQPLAVIEMYGVKSVVHARRAEDHMLGKLTPEFEGSFPQMLFYRRMTRREIPLIVLRPNPRAEVSDVGQSGGRRKEVDPAPGPNGCPFDRLSANRTDAGDQGQIERGHPTRRPGIHGRHRVEGSKPGGQAARRGGVAAAPISEPECRLLSDRR